MTGTSPAAASTTTAVQRSHRRGNARAGVPAQSLGAASAASTSAKSRTYCGVLELILRHPDVDPGQIADGEGVLRVHPATELDVDALGRRAGPRGREPGRSRDAR